MPPSGSDGSSPRVWGTLRHTRSSSDQSWFIPTGVGNSQSRSRPRYAGSVHPHGCGELWISRMYRGIPVGSSPRVWGTRRRNRSPMPIWSVHPHGCGELIYNSSSGAYAGGSSPRVWGTPISMRAPGSGLWFIPTGVGNSSVILSYLRPVEVHPHGCGELRFADDLPDHVGGSSPRVWGTLNRTIPPRPYVRFIPTGVGNSGLSQRLPQALPVHPHGCGELA